MSGTESVTDYLRNALGAERRTMATTPSDDLDIIAVAVQNTAAERNRVDGLLALERLRKKLLIQVEGCVPSQWYLDLKVENQRLVETQGLLIEAARPVIRRWREGRACPDEVASLDVAVALMTAKDNRR
jgi:hypothetical protein